MELAVCWRRRQPGGLSMAGIAFVFTITRGAQMLGEDEQLGCGKDWIA